MRKIFGPPSLLKKIFWSYLHNQACEHPLSREEAARVHILIDSLDEQGYLTDSLADIIEHTPLEWMLDEDDMQEALDRLQNLRPARGGRGHFE